MTSAAWNAQLLLLPERLAWHILLSLGALAAGILISFPLAIVCTRVRSLRGLLLAMAGAIQTVPSLALLALMVVLFGTIGLVPAMVALVLYSILPILRNTVTGIAGVDAAVLEAARGAGMTNRQILVKMQLPLAAPVIIAGIRTSAVWVVGIATLSTPVGQTSLGNYIFEGLQLRNNAAVAIGVFAAAALALGLDFLIRLLEVASERRSVLLGAAAGVALCTLAAAGTSPLMGRSANAIVGAKTFTEQYILADTLAQRLAAAGFRPRKAQGMGSNILFDALVNGNVDCYIDYSGTLWTNVMKRTDRVPREQMIDQIATYLREQHGIVCVGPLGFENTYCLAMRRARAQTLGLRSISDLAPRSGELTLGGDYEFFGRPEWTHVQQAYGLTFNRTVGLDSTLMYAAVQEGQVDVISAFSTDGRIDAFDLVILQDSRRSFPTYEALLLVSPAASARPGFVDALRPLVGSVSDAAMRRANRMVDVDGASPRAASATLAGPAAP